MAQMLKQQASGTSTSNNQPNLPRPSEIYYNKLTPALREKVRQAVDAYKRSIDQEIMGQK